ncbi:hypothetical protein [Haloarcula pelagica]|uniref:hypothetical protein n=1 Tax=Haloarcula pelagica TaxID=3033389 RepID=UPI0024C455E8|nr:hypothetical protein [Halomicroarcula sp. YJ-61-S]
MTVDIEPLTEYCEFGEDRVYLLLAIARAKENEGASHDVPTIRNVVEDAAGLERAVAELDHATRRFDARFRLYLTANARDALAATFVLRRRMDDWLEGRIHGDDGISAKFKRVDSEFKSVLQSDRCADDSNFVFDLDDAGAADAGQLQADLAAHTTVRMVRGTPNGYHLVTAPFNYTELSTDVAYEHKTDGLVFCSYLGE